MSGASVLQTEAYSAAIGAFVLIQSILRAAKSGVFDVASDFVLDPDFVRKNTTAQQASAGLHYFHKLGAKAQFQTTYIVESTILGASSTHVKRTSLRTSFGME